MSEDTEEPTVTVTVWISINLVGCENERDMDTGMGRDEWDALTDAEKTDICFELLSDSGLFEWGYREEKED